jgi:hypothetical protein
MENLKIPVPLYVIYTFHVKFKILFIDLYQTIALLVESLHFTSTKPRSTSFIPTNILGKYQISQKIKHFNVLRVSGYLHSLSNDRLLQCNLQTTQ